MSIQSAFTLFQVGAALIGGKGERALQRTQRGAEKAVREAQAKVQAAGNVRSGASAELARAAQGIGNRRMRVQATRREAAARAAVLAQRDADSGATFERRIGASERAGALAAEASAAGVAGGSFDLIAGTQALQQARQDFSIARAGRARDYGLEVDAADAARTAITGLDNRTIFATIDRAVQPVQPARQAGHWSSDLMNAAPADRLLRLAEDIQVKAGPYLSRLEGMLPGPNEAYLSPTYRGDEGDY